MPTPRRTRHIWSIHDWHWLAALTVFLFALSIVLSQVNTYGRQTRQLNVLTQQLKRRSLLLDLETQLAHHDRCRDEITFRFYQAVGSALQHNLKSPGAPADPAVLLKLQSSFSELQRYNNLCPSVNIPVDK